MSDFKKFRIEAVNDGYRFRVLVKGLFGWRSGYVHTNYFAPSYPSQHDARKAIEGYKTRFTDVE